MLLRNSSCPRPCSWGSRSVRGATWSWRRTKRPTGSSSAPMSQLFARKPIEDLQPPGGTEQSLKRVLGAGDLVMLAIGAVIGAGIFGAIGTAAAGQIGPSGEVIRY